MRQHVKFYRTLEVGITDSDMVIFFIFKIAAISAILDC